jgi:hypothetical protein
MQLVAFEVEKAGIKLVDKQVPKDYLPKKK